MIAGTGISTAVVASRFNARESIDDLASEYGVKPRQIEEAIRWEQKRQPSLPEDFVLYLDENLHNCRPILDALTKHGVKHERHVQHFSAGAEDTTWLPFVGRRVGY